jgi:peptide/nickel transport system ATP-binding protein
MTSRSTIDEARPHRDAVLVADDLSVTFSKRAGVRSKHVVHALRNVSVDVTAQETVAIVGESGSGKSTLLRTLAGLQRAKSGYARVGLHQLPIVSGRYPQAARAAVQMVFQDPYSSLNPAMTVAQLVGEGLATHTTLGVSEQRDRVAELLDAVGLSGDFARRRPSELSGGQRQRVGIARALAPNPKVLLLDEPVSSLDAVTQRQIVDVLARLQEQHQIAYLFVAHDLGLVRAMSSRVVVMYQGRSVETGPTNAVWSNPRHPYTQALLSAIPIADPVAQAERRAKRLSLAAATNHRERLVVQPGADGCPFAQRCPNSIAVCGERFPDVALDPAEERTVRCHVPLARLPRPGTNAVISGLIA